MLFSYGSVKVEERLLNLPVQAGLKLIGPLKTEVLGHSVETDNLRLKCFVASGTDCISCGVKATHFSVERISSKSYSGWVLNLYADNTLLTKDHIRPKSKGGADEIQNLQTMCWPCNSKKGNNFTD